MKSRLCRLTALLLAFATVVGANIVAAAADETEPAKPGYQYVLLYDKTNSTDWKPEETDKKVVLELYVINSSVNDPHLDGGSFGLRFPVRFSAEFKVDAGNVDTMPYGTSGGDAKAAGYYAFSWTKKPGADYAFTSTGEPKGVRMHIGTYTFGVGDKVPSKSSVGLLNWYNIAEAIPNVSPENPTQDPALDPFNHDIWYDTDGDGVLEYQGFYLDSALTGNPNLTPGDMNLIRTDIKFKWEPPEYWPNAATILSHDPKKLAVATLYDSEGTAVQSVELAIWQGSDTDGTYAAFGGKAPGTGLYYQALDLNLFTGLKAGTTYELVVCKPGHLAVKIPNLVAVSSQLGDAENLPEEEIYLPCGDIAPVRGASNEIIGFGNGAIKMDDRSMMLGFLNGAVEAVTPLKPIVGSDDIDAIKTPTNQAYYADINGDGVITLEDLSIFMSPMNYNRVSSASSASQRRWGSE